MSYTAWRELLDALEPYAQITGWRFVLADFMRLDDPKPSPELTAAQERAMPVVLDFAERLQRFREARSAQRLGVCDPEASAPATTRCCCADRMPCFNMTRNERRFRVSPPCVPGPPVVQRLVASDMPLGWCCTWRQHIPRRRRKPFGRGRATAAGKRNGA